MNDLEYDSYLKKNIAHSARRRKCGSKSKKCHLSTDRMSHKEWIERCGDVMSYQIGKPMVWAEFNKLPRDLKEEYMNTLILKYSMNARNFAEMFGVSVATVFRVVKNDGLNVGFTKGRKPTGEQRVAYERFICGEADIAECTKPADEPAVGETMEELQGDSGNSKLVEEKAEPKTRLDSFTMNFSGEINIDMIANSLRYILGTKQDAKIQIICELT